MTSNERYDSLFQFYAEKYGLEWEMLKKQAIAESNLRPNAHSPVGANGLMQFMPVTWMEWNPSGHPLDPEASIETGARYMQWLLKQFQGDYRKALAAYNWGIGRMKKIHEEANWEDNLPDETQTYLKKILG